MANCAAKGGESECISSESEDERKRKRDEEGEDSCRPTKRMKRTEERMVRMREQQQEIISEREALQQSHGRLARRIKTDDKEDFMPSRFAAQERRKNLKAELETLKAELAAQARDEDDYVLW